MTVIDEIPFPRRINGDAVALPSGLLPSRIALEGAEVRLEPVNPGIHGRALYAAGHDSEAALHVWDYLAIGPYPNEDAFLAYLRDCAAGHDPLHFAICERDGGRAAGMASIMDIQPKTGVVEIGAI